MRTLESSALLPVVLGMDVGDRITVKRRPPGGGATVEKNCHVEEITLRIEPAVDITADLVLSPVSADVPVLLGTGVLGTAALIY